MNENKLIRLSSVSKKIFMGAAGLFLIIFLFVHLIINLFLLRGDNGEWFNSAASFMSNNYVIRIFEFVLFGSFLLHITIGVILFLKNRSARPTCYAVPSKSSVSFFSRYMIWTGLTIFTILIIHFINFYFVKLGLVPLPIGINSKHDFYHMAVALFSQPLYSLIYYIWLLVLGLHLYHAFQSVFQTFGLNHNRYNCFIKRAAIVYAIVMSFGFMIIPTYFLFFYNT